MECKYARTRSRNCVQLLAGLTLPGEIKRTDKAEVGVVIACIFWRPSEQLSRFAPCAQSAPISLSGLVDSILWDAIAFARARSARLPIGKWCVRWTISRVLAFICSF